MMKRCLLLFALFAFLYVNSMQDKIIENEHDDDEENSNDNYNYDEEDSGISYVGPKKTEHEEKIYHLELMHAVKMSILEDLREKRELTFKEKFDKCMHQTKERFHDTKAILIHFYMENKFCTPFDTHRNGNFEHIEEIKCVIKLQGPYFIFALVNWFLPALQDFDIGMKLSFAQFVTVGSGYCCLKFEWLHSGLTNGIIFGFNVWYLVQKYSSEDYAGEGELAMIHDSPYRPLQQALILAAPAVLEIARAHELIFSDKGNIVKLDNAHFPLLLNLLLTCFLPERFFLWHLVASHVGTMGISDKYALGLLMAVNVLLLLVYGAYDEESLKFRIYLNLPLCLFFLCCRQVFVKNDDQEYQRQLK